MQPDSESVAVLGGGITGLSLAWALQNKGIPVTLYERSGEPGGVIKTHSDSGWKWEEGPNTLLIKSEAVWKMLRDLGLEEEARQARKSARKRYIVKEGEPTPLPMSLIGLLVTPLFSTSAKLRLLKEPFVESVDKEDDSIASFVKRRLGEEILHYAVNPFVSGIFAGDPERLSIKHTFSDLWEAEQKHGSILKGMIRKEKATSARRVLVSFDGGLQELPRALARRLGDSLQLNTRISRIHKKDGEWLLDMESEENDSTHSRHKIVVSTLPAHILPGLLEAGVEEGLVDTIAGIPYAPMSVVVTGYRRDQVRHPLDGFGMLVPRKEGLDILGTLFSSSLFSGRAPEGRVLLTTFVGGARSPELASLPQDEHIERVQFELDQLLGVQGTPEWVRHTFWERAIPQYETGYDRYLDAMKQIEKRNEGFLIRGNFRGGVSVPDCITSGIETAEKVALLFEGDK